MTGVLAAARRHPRALSLACAVVWLGAFGATHVPPRHVPSAGISDVALHAAGYLILGSAFWLALWARGSGRSRRAVIVLVVMLGYAAADELTQPLFERSAAWGDLLADAAGAAAALIVWETLAWRARTGQSP